MNPWEAIWDHRNLILSGLWLTLVMSVITIVTSTLLGLGVALLYRARIPVVTQILRGYIELFRGSPMLIQLLFIYFGAAYLGVRGFVPFAAACVSITLYIGALNAEVFRAGLESVPDGQVEAARTLGLSRFDRTVFVVLPQAMRISLAPLVGQWIALVKYTSFASIIGVPELVRQGQGIIERYGGSFEVLTVVAALYFILCFPMSQLASYLERKTVRS